ncbi:MAG TPA: OmpA family protein [Gammaproteobacteria bacterium]|nr:OmpA family protein [Gammaproteobacteria bacterium]
MSKRRFNVTLASLALAVAAAAAMGQNLRGSLFQTADQRLAAAEAANAELLAPSGFEDAMERYAEAEEDLARGRNIERIRSALAEAVRLFDQAIESSEIAEITLASLLKTREDSLSADAPTFASELWAEAEESFDETTRRLEGGNIRVARELSDETEALFRDAELTAIKAQYLSQTRALLAQAEQQRVARYAPATFARAQALLERAETELNENRYDTDLPRSLAQQANYEARHAIYLAQQIERMDEGEITAEQLILSYEDPLTRIAAAADRVAPLDQGTEAIAAELILFIEELREEAAQSQVDLSDSRARIAELEDEIRELDEQLGGVSQERVALVQRLEAEARIREQFATIESMFDREEARVSREGNTLVLRLVGLTFESGSSGIVSENHALLQKVAQATSVFPRSQLVIEGHTDSYGSDDNNMTLSRARADAVSAYLADNFGIPAFRTSSVGYGETQPIANNETPQGRARNRRIDVRIEPELE